MEQNKNPKSTPVIKYEICSSAKLGRYIVAAKNLSAGEVILREKPAAVGPGIFANKSLCFGCLRPFPDILKSVPYICSKCNVAPLCNSSCESKLHSADECDLFLENKTVFRENLILVTRNLLQLRLWILRKHNSKPWKDIECMEAHMNERRGTKVWKDREANIVEVFRKLRLIEEETESAEIIQWICGIVDVNSFELRSPGNLEVLLLRGLFTEASLMSHDCRGNTHITVSEEFEMTVYASLPILKGSNITFNYTSSLSGTADRREHLREGKYFECECSACMDPYEGGTCLSSILCPRCKIDYIAIEQPLEKNPYSTNTKWQCKNCKRFFQGCLIKTTIDVAQNLLSEIDESDIKEMEKLLAKLSTTFHTNHFLMLNLKQKLLGALRKEVSRPINPQKKYLQRMVDLCKEVMNVLEIVEPGISRLKGILLYEMHLPMAILANRSYTANQICSRKLLSCLEEARIILKRSLSMLLLEPTNTPEGLLAKRALQELKILTGNIEDIKMMPVDMKSQVKSRTQRRNNKFR